MCACPNEWRCLNKERLPTGGGTIMDELMLPLGILARRAKQDGD